MCCTHSGKLPLTILNRTVHSHCACSSCLLWGISGAEPAAGLFCLLLCFSMSSLALLIAIALLIGLSNNGGWRLH